MSHLQLGHPSFPRTEDRPAAESNHVIGVDIGGTNLRMALADLSGTIKARWSTSTVGVREASIIVGLIGDGMAHLLQQSGVSRECLLAIAAGAPGVTDVDSGVVVATSYLLGWRNVPLREMLEMVTGLPAAIDNDVNLAALGEKWLGIARESRDFVFLAIGTGVGAGIVLHGELYRGLGWTAGEIGYMLVPGVPERPVLHGEPGALESIVGGEGIRTRWRTQWSEARTKLPRDLTATQIFEYGRAGDDLAQSILWHAATTLSYAILNIALVLNCPLFVLGGGIGMHPVLCDTVRALLEQRNARATPRLALSILGSEAQLIGAIRLAIDTAAEERMRSPR